MKINLDTFNEYVDKKLITCREHPKGGLLIWNYTPAAQYTRTWDDVTMAARGLITDLEGTVKARPFKKFFNYSEYQGDIPADEPFEVHEKLDGSLGIMYTQPNGTLALATRGSFMSDQALVGTRMLWQYLEDNGTDWILPGWTYLFEIIYPANRIVVDYGVQERLVLLAVINTETGEEMSLSRVRYPDKAKKIPVPGLLQLAEDMATHDGGGKEGCVLHWPESGLRLKMKFPEYVRLHRILTNVSSKNIWEYLKTGQPMDELLEKVPDEFYQWVKTTRHDLVQKHADLINTAHVITGEVEDLPDRKTIAGELSAHPKTIQALVWAMLDHKSDVVQKIAWDAVKPSYEKPFKEDIDA